MKETSVGLFPGQGSQYVGMGRKLAALEQRASEVFDLASDATGRDIRHLCWAEDASVLQRTENAQLALTVVSLAAHAAFQGTAGSEIVALYAGHSVGAIAAASAAGYLSIESAVKLAAARGHLMASAPDSGGMLAVAVTDTGSHERQVSFGSDLADRFGLEVAAYNGPRQIVLSGGVEALGKAADALGAKSKRLVVSHAFHSHYMKPLVDEWQAFLRDEQFSSSGRGYIGCTSGVSTSDGEVVREDLLRGLTCPVVWTSVMEHTQDFQSTYVFGAGRAIARLSRPYVDSRDLFSVEDRVPTSKEKIRV